MFENLSDKLQRAFKNLRGEGTVSEENINDALREIRVALLEADVNLSVVKEMIEHVREKAMGSEVMTALSPTEQVIKIVRDELITILGKDTARFNFASRPPTVILMAGLQGSGKTTTLAAMLNEINQEQEFHMVTLEDPIEFLHPHIKSTFSQRELGKDFSDFSVGLRAALRQAPKVILVGEIRDRVTMEIAMTAAEARSRRRLL